MAWYNENGEKAPNVVQIEKDGRKRWKFNPAEDEAWRTANGYTFDHNPVPPPQPEPVDRTEFDAACVQFRSVCAQIGQAIGDEDFRGGFDEMAEFQRSAAFNSLEGLQLAVAWSAANELCKYLGGKIGLGQPDWWYECWKGVEEE